MHPYRHQVDQAESIILLIADWGLRQKQSVFKRTRDGFVCRVCDKSKFRYRFEEGIKVRKDDVSESLLFNFANQIL